VRAPGIAHHGLHLLAVGWTRGLELFHQVAQFLFAHDRIDYLFDHALRVVQRHLCQVVKKAVVAGHPLPFFYELLFHASFSLTADIAEDFKQGAKTHGVSSVVGNRCFERIRVSSWRPRADDFVGDSRAMVLGNSIYERSTTGPPGFTIQHTQPETS